MKTYRVLAGETLYGIAKKLLGDGNRYRDFLKWNPEVTDPNRIYAGQVLQYPDTEATYGPPAPAPLSSGVKSAPVAMAQTPKPISPLMKNLPMIGAVAAAGVAAFFLTKKKPQAA